jgi:hypothetical protein
MRISDIMMEAKDGTTVQSASDTDVRFKAVKNAFDETLTWLKYQRIGTVVQVDIAVFNAKNMRKTDYEII